MYAIVEIRGKQYKVQEGDIVFVDRMDEVEEGKEITFDKVLFLSDGKKVTVGTDTVKGAKVKATVIGHGKSKKILVFKYKAKKNERKMRGHRQPYTKIQIEKITTTAEKANYCRKEDYWKERSKKDNCKKNYNNSKENNY